MNLLIPALLQASLADSVSSENASLFAHRHSALLKLVQSLNFDTSIPSRAAVAQSRYSLEMWAVTAPAMKRAAMKERILLDCVETRVVGRISKYSIVSVGEVARGSGRHGALAST